METTSGAFSDVVAALKLDWSSGRGDMMAAGTQGYSADELTEVSLRVGLLGEPMPPILESMAFMIQTADPLTPLDGLGAPEGQRPCARSTAPGRASRRKRTGEQH